MIALPPPIWIDTPPALARLAAEFSHQPRLAVDTESNSLHAYRERVCLIQFSAPGADYLVDPLALGDLSPLAPIFSDPGVEKIFHAVEYDLIGLKRDHGIAIAHVFDTMQAARILGYARVGLDGLLGEKFGLAMDKRYQKADWAQRPLPPDLLNYARLDTHFLPALRNLLEQELAERGLWQLALEEFTRLAQGSNNGRNDEDAWQRIGRAHRLDGCQLAVLQEVWQWRECRAEHMDRPVFKVLSEKTLAEVARAAPRSRADLERAGLTPRQVNAYGRELLQAVARGLQALPVHPPRQPRPAQAYLDRLDALSEWRKQAARKMGVDSDIVLPRVFMYAIAERNPKNTAELAEVMPRSPWRIERYGTEILAATRRAA